MAIICLWGTSSVAGRPANPPRSPAAAQSSHFQQEVDDILKNEVQAQTNDHTLWRFHEVQEKGGARRLFDVVQTKLGDIHRLLAIDGRPLTGNDLAAEDDRIQALLSNPSRIKAAQKKREQDAKEERSLLETFPSAFIFHDQGQQGNLLKVGFVPNPNFRPTSHEAEVFHHMEGTMVLDTKARRLAEIDGRLTSEVKFWGGLLGHLDEGGTFHVVQRYVADGHWDETLLDVHMDGKALFFKTLAVRQKEIYSNYQEEPENLTPQQAAQQLKKDSAVNASLTGN